MSSLEGGMSIKFLGMRRRGRTLAEVHRRKGKPLIENRFGGELATENDKHLEEMQYFLFNSLLNISDIAKVHRIIY